MKSQIYKVLKNSFIVTICLFVLSCNEKREESSQQPDLVTVTDTSKLKTDLEKIVDLLPPDRTRLGRVSFLDETFKDWLIRTGELPPDFDNMPSIPFLPDPLILDEGGKNIPITTKSQWQEKRRWMKEQLEYYITGTYPPKPDNLQAEILSEKKDGETIVRMIELTFGPERQAKLTVELMTPPGEGSFPVFMTQWNHREWAQIAVRRIYVGCVYAGADAGTYIQNTIRKEVIETRKKNDILFIPVGCTELHGVHTVTGLDTFMVTQILEGIRRYTAKKGAPVNLSWTPLNFGGHPHHHIGMPGTIHLEDEVVKRILFEVMVGFWNDGFRKIILINKHRHQWLLEAAIQELQKTWNLPGIFRVIDWHRAVREFFRTKERCGDWDTNFVHADEAETSVMLLLSPEYVNMEYAEETSVEGYLPDGHFDKAVDPFARPSKWSEGQGHFSIELGSIPEGIVGFPTLGEARKARRTIAAILSYLTLVHDEIIEAFPAGKVPPIEKTTMRTEKEMEPYLKEPFTEGWCPIYSIPKMGL